MRKTDYEEEKELRMTERIRTPERVQDIIKRTRHKKEVPIYMMLVVLGLIAISIAVFKSLAGDGLAQIKQILAYLGLSESAPNYGKALAAILIFMSLTGGIIYTVGLFLAVLVNYYRYYAGEMAYSIRVSETNYPELNAKVKEFSRLLGFAKPPEVFVRQMNGQVNAFTSWIPGKPFIQVNAEIVDLGYMEHGDFETVGFVLAHEFGHIYLHHVQIFYAFWPMLVSFIPVIGNMILMPLLSRAREYSADRVAQALTDRSAQLDGMMMLSAGRHAYKYINPDAYIYETLVNHKRLERFARFIVNMLASHPIMPYRVWAVMDPDRKSGSLYFFKNSLNR